ncbi:TPA: phage head closure protein [Clostridioides difficile]|nr:phage head closure protein [Clostridioides difficile]
MNIGDLNKRIIIQKNNESIDREGYPIENWINYKTVWSRINNISGKEFLQAQALTSNISKKAFIRYQKELDISLNDNITLNYRILYNKSIYNLIYINNINEKNQYMELMLVGDN